MTTRAIWRWIDGGALLARNLVDRLKSNEEKKKKKEGDARVKKM